MHVPNRREFIALSLASSALPILADERTEDAPYLESRDAGRARCSAVIVEMTSPLALAFRAEAVELGLEVHGIHDDITDLWYHKLDRQWKSAPATLAGITLSTSLFCLETFARDYGMRVWFRALHNKTANGQAERLMSGDERLVEQAAVLDGEWAGSFARFATIVPLSKSVKFQQKVVETAALQSEELTHMISWIIAPRLRNQSGIIS
jgi:hypothetical protein